MYSGWYTYLYLVKINIATELKKLTSHVFFVMRPRCYR